MTPSLETKFAAFEPTQASTDGAVEGYAALFDTPDRAGDIIARGAFARSLAHRAASVKFLWQHDAAEPIGLWDHLAEDARGLKAKGRLLPSIRRGSESIALLSAGALDGLSIGFRTIRSERAGAHRLLTEIELWEISLVTFPMAEGARLSSPLAEEPALATAIRDAAQVFSSRG